MYECMCVSECACVSKCVSMCWSRSAKIKNKRGRVSCSEMNQLIKCPLSLIVT